ncbi:MAG: hypothetical protein HY074_20300 [Deltaproteobacteria bacterium]|nr:hypothetical protein [Deltaproteobacteria bacterium]
MSKLDTLLEQIRDSETYQQIKLKYDELDSRTKLYVNLGAVAGVVFVVFLSLVISMAKLNGLKSEINDREDLIGYLQRSGDQIKQLQAAQRNSHSQSDTSSPFGSLVNNALQTLGIDPSKVDVGSEHPGSQTKTAAETLLDVKLTQVNLRQIQQLLFSLGEQGALRGISFKDLTIDTKGDPSGWMDANFVVSTWKEK